MITLMAKKNAAIKSLALALTFLITLFANNASSDSAVTDDCQLPTNVASMEITSIKVSNGETFKQINALIADEPAEQAAGFQHVCAKDAQTPILFVFNIDYQPNFHMNNVTIPLVIYFLDRNGLLVDRFLMEVYQKDGEKPLYKPHDKIRYALEVPYEMAMKEPFLNEIISVTDININH